MAPSEFYHKLKSYYSGLQGERQPMLSVWSSAFLSVFFVALYVIPFYLSRKTRPSPTLNRDAPSVIKARIQTVTFTVTVSTITAFYLLYVIGKLPLLTTIHYLGLYPIDPLSIAKSLVLTFLLYLGPLYDRLYLQKDLSPLATLLTRTKLHLSSSQGYRNWVAGPLTEELLWRSTLIPLHLLAHVSNDKIVFVTPLYFGIAHIHHFYEFLLTHPGTPILQGLFRSIFQFSYTTIFGWYASFVYLRTANLYAVYCVHVFCNIMGLPRLWGKVRLRDEPDFSSTIIRGKEDIDMAGLGQYSQELPLRHTVVYYTLLVVGAYLFYCGLFPLTESAEALVSFGEK